MSTPDQPLNPPEYPTRSVSFTVTRIYTYDIEVTADNDDEVMACVREAARTDAGVFEEQLIEIDEVCPRCEY